MPPTIIAESYDKLPLNVTELAEYKFEYTPDDKFIPEKVRERINQKLESQKVNELEIERVWTPAAQHLEDNFNTLAKGRGASEEMIIFAPLTVSKCKDRKLMQPIAR